MEETMTQEFKKYYKIIHIGTARQFREVIKYFMSLDEEIQVIVLSDTKHKAATLRLSRVS